MKGQIRVKRSVTRGIVTTPKSRKSREVPLGVEAIATLKDARHLKGPLVFSIQPVEDGHEGGCEVTEGPC